ncbi:MAG: hypothetical protein KF752_15140 [Pirellulaceae bacterium]|nr:hypothetical protein [Pirellulaceae bacterium]
MISITYSGYWPAPLSFRLKWKSPLGNPGGILLAPVTDLVIGSGRARDPALELLKKAWTTLEAYLSRLGEQVNPNCRPLEHLTAWAAPSGN